MVIAEVGKAVAVFVGYFLTKHPDQGVPFGAFVEFTRYIGYFIHFLIWSLVKIKDKNLEI